MQESYRIDHAVIKRGEKGDPHACPIAIKIAFQKTGALVDAYPDEIVLALKGEEDLRIFLTSDALKYWIDNFDGATELSVEPWPITVVLDYDNMLASIKEE